MSRSISMIFVFAMLFALVGCNKPDPNPELLDPIYKDLQSNEKSNSDSYTSELAKQEETKKKIEEAEPNSIDLAQARKELKKSELVAVKYKQMALYYKIRAERRKVVDHITYQEAFAQKKPWPDRTEYSKYETNVRLNSVNLNWGARVPKLKDRITNYERKPAAKPEAKKSE